MEYFLTKEEEDDFHYEGGEAREDKFEDFAGDFFDSFSLTMEDPFTVGEVGDGDGGNPGKNGRSVIFEMDNIEAEMVGEEIDNSRDGTPESVGDDVDMR